MKPQVYIRPPTSADEQAFVASSRASRRIHGAWLRAPDTPQTFREFLVRVASPTSFSFLVCRSETDELAGVVNLSNVVLGSFRSGYLGYYAFAGHERQGNMAAGLRLVIRHAFSTLKLHRLEANIQPENLRSISLVERCGFAKEGFSPRYLKISGRWRDHERWAILAS